MQSAYEIIQIIVLILGGFSYVDLGGESNYAFCQTKKLPDNALPWFLPFSEFNLQLFNCFKAKLLQKRTFLSYREYNSVVYAS